MFKETNSTLKTNPDFVLFFKIYHQRSSGQSIIPGISGQGDFHIKRPVDQTCGQGCLPCGVCHETQGGAFSKVCF